MKNEVYSCFSKVFLLVSLLCCISTSTFAYDLQSVDDYGTTIYYNLINDSKEAEVAAVTFNFYSCYGNIKIPETVTDTDGNSLSVTSIGDGAFRSADYLYYITIPSTVTNIGNYAFAGIEFLYTVEIPDKVITIGDGAFSGCMNLTYITIGNSVKRIGSGAFKGCSCLTNVFVKDIAAWCSIKFYDYESNPLYYAHHLYDNERTEIKDLEIPSTVTNISDNAFKGCSGLTSVTIGSSVESIGEGAFSDCTGLTKITIPNNVTNIGDNAFKGCDGLTSVSIGSSVTSIGSSAFNGCTGLTEVTLQGKDLPECNSTAFQNIDLSKVTLYCLPSLVASCEEPSTLWSGFKTIVPAVTLTEAGTLSEMIGESYKNTITTLKVSGPINGTDVLYLREMAGKDYNGYDTNGTLVDLVLTDANIVEGGESYYLDHKTTNNVLGDYMFCNCELQSIKLPNSVTSIGYHAFSACYSLTSVTFPDEVTSIDGAAFYHCSSLTSITIPDKVNSIGTRAFFYCTGLTSIEVEAGNAYYYSEGNCLIETANNTLIRACNLTNITIPNTVTIIGDDAFSGCSNLTSIAIPDNVTSIGYCVFNGCTGLTEVTLQGKVLPTSCNADAFYGIDLSKVKLYCKAALEKKCQETDPWKNFDIVVKPFSITITDVGLATGCFDDDLDFTDLEVNAYIASGYSPSEGKVLMTRVVHVPAGTGFIVKGVADTYEIPAVATDYTYVNMLEGVLEKTAIETTADDYSNFILGRDGEDAAFIPVPAEGATVPANKAYLRILTSAVSTSDNPGSDAKTSLGLSFDDDDTTGISEIKEQNNRTSGTTVIYNLNGQRKQSLTKGLNIVNGKKIFVK